MNTEEERASISSNLMLTVSLNTKPLVLRFISLKQCIISAVITEAVGTSGDQSKLQTSLPS